MSYQVHVATVGAHISQNQPREEDRLDALRQIFNAFVPFVPIFRLAIWCVRNERAQSIGEACTNHHLLNASDF